MKLYVGVFVIALGLVIAIVGIRGTYAQAWETVFGAGKAKPAPGSAPNPPPTSNVPSGPGAPGQQGGGNPLPPSGGGPPVTNETGAGGGYAVTPVDLSVAQAQGALI